MRVRDSVVCGAILFAACSSHGHAPAGPGGAAGSVANQPAQSAEEDGGRSAAQPGGLCTQAGECEQHMPPTNALHVEGTIDYPDPPPVGGMHNPCWGDWGVHAKPLPAENWVHNLEHGGIVLLYNCPDGCKSEVAQLSAFVDGHPRTILTSYSNMHARFAVVAWGYRLLMQQQLDLDAVGRFYVAHFDQGPESIDSPPPSGCP